MCYVADGIWAERATMLKQNKSNEGRSPEEIYFGYERESWGINPYLVIHGAFFSLLLIDRTDRRYYHTTQNDDTAATEHNLQIRQ